MNTNHIARYYFFRCREMKYNLKKLLVYFILSFLTTISSQAFSGERIFEEQTNSFPAEGYSFSRKYVGFPIKKSDLINQLEISDSVCGPTAILNALILGNYYIRSCYDLMPGQNGAGKLLFVINEYGGKPSIEYPGTPRLNDDGICSVDLLYLFNDLLADNRKSNVSGEYIVREKGESDSHFLNRSHEKLVRSIKKGMPVVAHIRSFAAKKNSEQDKVYWYSLSSHYITITKIPEQLADYENGFEFEYLDPYKARIESGYVGVEKNRAFNAKFGVNNNSKWIKGKSFLLVNAPSLNLKFSEQKWHDRAIMTLNYVIGYLD